MRHRERSRADWMRPFPPGCAAALFAVLVAGPALAHPHIFINAKAELVFTGRALTAIRHTWQFDDAFSAFAVQGLDQNNDGKLSDAELAPLAELNVKSLSRPSYYTYVTADQKNLELAAPTDYRVEWAFGRLTLYFTLPLKAATDVMRTASVQVFDPEYYTAFNFATPDPVKLSGAPTGCTGSYVPPQPLDEVTLAALYA